MEIVVLEVEVNENFVKRKREREKKVGIYRG